MADLADIREALAAQLAARIPGLRTQTDTGAITNPPCAVVLPAQGTLIDYTIAFEQGVADYNMRVVILVPGETADRVATALIDTFVAIDGPSSIPAAILADPTLGAVVDFAVPVTAQNFRPVEWAGFTYTSAEILVKVGAQ